MGALRRGARLQEGQASVEYVGVIVIVGVIIASLLIAQPGLPESVGGSVRTAMCALFDACDDATQVAAGDVSTPAGSQDGETTDQSQPGDGDQGGDGGQPDGDEDQGFFEEFGNNFVDGWGQVFGGFGAQVWDEVKGIGDTAAWVWRTATSADQRRENGEVWDAVTDDPWGAVTEVWNGIWDPAAQELENGRDAAAVGRGTAIVLTAVFGAKGLSKLSTLNKADNVVPDSRGPDGRRDAVPCPDNSFTATTRVLLADGSAVPIAEIQIGTLVLAGDPQSGVIRPRPVTDVIVGGGDKHLVELDVGGGTVVATGGHPFYVAGTGAWTAAADLRPGDHLLTPDDGRAVVETTADRVVTTTVYNLTVADLHTFYVLADETALLVHNQRRDCGDDADGDDAGGTPVPPPLVYQRSPKHGDVNRGNVAKAPVNGQAALNRSVQVRDTSTRRVGVDYDNNEIVVFDETFPDRGIFHGHVRTWDQLRPEQRSALQRAGLLDRRGNITKPPEE